MSDILPGNDLLSAEIEAMGQRHCPFQVLDDTNIMVVTALFVFRETVGNAIFPGLLYASVVILAVLNIASFRMPKPGDRWLYVVGLYVVGTSVLLWRQGVSG